jgi:hypothetical protein
MDEHPATADPTPMSSPDHGKIKRGLVTILYSVHRDAYKLPHVGKDLWLSVQVCPLEGFGRKGGSHVGAVQTANDRWRLAYRSRGIIQPGATATIPEDDMMVVDYLTAVSDQPSALSQSAGSKSV